MRYFTFTFLLIFALESRANAFHFPKTQKLQTRQNLEYAEPWSALPEEAQEQPCTCMSVLQCGASMRNGEYEENNCPIDGDVCCILSSSNTDDGGREDLSSLPEEVPAGEVPQNCNCVPITECGGSLRQDDEDEESEENPCANPSEVCCFPQNEGQPEKPESPNPRPGTVIGPGGPGHIDEPSIVDEFSLECGQSQTNFPTVYPSSAVTEQNANFGELPWTVLLYVKNPNAENNGIGDYKCAGTLIWPSLVLTAAHCLDKQKLSDITVRAGEWDLFADSQEPLPFQETGIHSAELHPNYVSGHPLFDLAIVVLVQPFTLTKNVNKACLPNYSLDEVDTTSCVSAGWGKTPGGLQSGILKKIVMPIVEKKQCQAALRTTRLGKYFKLHKSFLCAGGRADQDVCQGDGGGPLTCKSKANGAMTLVGVTSWGVGCGKPGIPGVFADVLFLNSWLNDYLVRNVVE